MVMPAKRSDQRHGHRTKAEQSQVDTSQRGSAVVQWPAADPGWHPIAVEWFNSLPESGQVVFFEPSDVALAKYVAAAMTESLTSSKGFGAMLFANVMSAAGELLSSEASRRRLKIELQKDVVEDPEQLEAVASIADRRARMTG